MSKSYKIAILPTLKASCKLATENLKAIFLLCWLPLSLLILLNFLDYHFFVIDETLKFFQISEYYKYAYILTDALIIVPLAVGIYRYYILNEFALCKFEYKRGIIEPKTVFKIFWYFKFYKREFFFFVPCVLIAFLFLLIQKTTTYALLEILNFDNGLNKTHSYIFAATRYFILFIEGIVLASTILVWAYLAISDKPKIRKIPNLIKMIKGNIFRVYLIRFIIYLPVHGINYIFINAQWIAPKLWDNYIIFELSNAFETIIYFACLCVDIAFISLIYKGLTERIDHE